MTVESDPAIKRPWDEWGRHFAPALESLGGTAGFLAEDAPPGWPARGGVDAFLLSTDNALS